MITERGNALNEFYGVRTVIMITWILIIDDDDAVRTLLERVLRKEGYAVLSARNGIEGLELVRKFKPALVISDWLMPQKNGIEVCQDIKGNPELQTTYFILITSLKEMSNHIQGLDAGADDFLTKPVHLGELLARVRAGMRIYHLSADLQDQKHRLELELAEAGSYVRSILPSHHISPPLTLEIEFIPSRQLGGDAYDYYWLDEDHFIFYLLDGAGHGLRSALPSLTVLQWLRSKPLQELDYCNPKQVLSSLNQYFLMTESNQYYFTIWYGVYHRPTRQLTYSSAGHPPAVFIPNSEPLQPLKIKGCPIGMFPDYPYQVQTCFIPVNATLFLFSDGLYELHPENPFCFTFEHLQDWLKDRVQDNPQVIVNTLKQEHHIKDFCDDICLLKLTFN